jgi:hypothetical protein
VSPRRKKALLLAFMSVAGVATTLLVWQLLQPADRTPEVGFDDFLAEVHAGHVQQVYVDGDRYEFIVWRDRTGIRERTTGPRPDIAFVRSLRPSSPDLVAPQVYFRR